MSSPSKKFAGKSSVINDGEFVLGLVPHSQIAAQLGVSKQATSKLEAKAFKKLRSQLESAGIEGFEQLLERSTPSSRRALDHKHIEQELGYVTSNSYMDKAIGFDDQD